MNILMLAAVVAVNLANVGEVKLDCADAKGWSFALTSSRDATGRETVKISANAEKACVPPAFTVSFLAPGAGVHNVWTCHFEQEGFHLWPQAWKDCLAATSAWGSL